MFFGFAVFVLLSSTAQSALRDTVSPNEFWFESDVYYVDTEATNVVISVGFAPGSRSWSGSVDFSVSDGTAVAGIDFQPTNGTLNFSGPGTPIPVINIPILPNKTRTSDKTVLIHLSNPDAFIHRPDATLVIAANEPTLSISPGTNPNSVMLTWPALYDDYVLEKSHLLSDQWTEVTAARNFHNGECNVSESCGTQPVFYRLRKPASP